MRSNLKRSQAPVLASAVLVTLWGIACTPGEVFTPPDAGDMNKPVDSGSTADAGNSPSDAGNSPSDAGNSPSDAGNSPSDAGNSPSDAGQLVNRARPFSAASPWNTPTPSGTTWYDTTSLHQLNGGAFRHWWVNTASVGIFWATSADPLWTFDMPAYVAPLWHRNRPAAVFQRNAPSGLAAGTDVDHILVLVNADTGDYAEVWEASVDAGARRVTNIPGSPGWATGNAVTGPGAGTLANNDGVRAANFSWAAGLITGADLDAGKIDHALVIALTSDTLMGGGSTGCAYGQSCTSATAAWVAPATAWDTGPWTGPIKMGSRIGVPSGVAAPAGLSALGVMMFNALQKYGAFVGDFAGGNWPMFYGDNRSVTEAQLLPLFAYWNYGGSADMEKIGPLLRVADYQP